MGKKEIISALSHLNYLFPFPVVRNGNSSREGHETYQYIKAEMSKLVNSIRRTAS